MVSVLASPFHVVDHPHLTTGLAAIRGSAGRAHFGPDGDQIVVLDHRNCQGRFDVESEQAMLDTCAQRFFHRRETIKE